MFDPPGVCEAHRSLEVDIDKLPALEDAGRETPVVVRLSDPDANGHANNARIAEWIVEGVGRDSWQGSRIRGLDVDFMAEALHGDTIVSRSRADGEGGHLHSLVRGGDGREIARGRTWWTPR